MRRKLEPGEIEEVGFNLDDEEYNKLLDDIEKLQSDENLLLLTEYCMVISAI
ncbi:MAG: hypothetical protein LUG66_05505 [Clostridiales bacterium]|nr:hypothetical protein [Clostridiales bacterium]